MLQFFLRSMRFERHNVQMSIEMLAKPVECHFAQKQGRQPIRISGESQSECTPTPPVSPRGVYYY